VLNNTAIQVDEQYWGSDRFDWNPSRWLTADTSSSKSLDGETQSQRPERSYIAWSTGPRVCPGKKFSQVEHTAALATLFHKHRVAPVVRQAEGETIEQARERIMEVIQDSTQILVFRMNRPEDMSLQWERDK
jgi:cytochrome P450